MRTLVEVVARRGPGGRTVLPVVRASGQLAVRRTGPTTVHLVATAFGPLGGDDADIRLVVEQGATLSVRSVAAAVAPPAGGGARPVLPRDNATGQGKVGLRWEAAGRAAGAGRAASVRPAEQRDRRGDAGPAVAADGRRGARSPPRRADRRPGARCGAHRHRAGAPGA